MKNSNESETAFSSTAPQKPEIRLVVPKSQIRRKRKLRRGIRFTRTTFGLWAEIAKVWQEFCDSTTFAGLRHIGGKRTRRNFSRFQWIVVYLLLVAMSVWLSYRVFARYMQYDVASSTTFDTFKELQFPAITICNQNMFRRSVVGGSPGILYAISYFYANSQEEVANLSAKNIRTCSKKTTDQLYLDQSITEIMKLMAMDSRINVAKCWWMSKEINCSGIFLNHLTDYGWCFTFNQYQSAPRYEDSKEFQIFGGFGLDDTVREWKTITGGPRNGLQLLLNVAQEDYCGAGYEYFGAGFYVQVHDPKSHAELLILPSISIHPGSTYDIALKPVSFQRDTEHLGKCLSHMKLKMYPNYDRYYQMACWAECLTIKMRDTCGCFPASFEGKQEFLAKSFGMRLSDVKICSLGQYTCMHRTTQDFSHYMKEMCPQCKVACVETFYENQVSSGKIRDLVVSDLNISSSKEKLTKNYALVNFYFDTMTLQTVKEFQAVSFTDFITAFGWALNLFLGNSFITPFELVHSIALSLVNFYKHLRLRRKVGVVNNKRPQNLKKVAVAFV